MLHEPLVSGEVGFFHLLIKQFGWMVFVLKRNSKVEMCMLSIWINTPDYTQILCNKLYTVLFHFLNFSLFAFSILISNF